MSILKLDFNCFLKSPIVGYGRAYLTMRDALSDICRNGSGVRLTEKPLVASDVQVFLGVPINENLAYCERKADRFIIYTMWESTVVPKIIVDRMNEYFDEVIVPSEWGKQVFINSGVEKPITVIPLGIKTDDWPLLDRGRGDLKTFNVLWQGTFYGDRKGGELAVEAFDRADLPDSKMLLKSNSAATKNRATWRLPLPYKGRIRMDIISVGNVYDQDRMLKMSEEADVLIYPSLGEGFGLIPLEHGSTGLPSIVSNNTAMTQYLDALPMANMSDFQIMCHRHDCNYFYPVRCHEKSAIYGEECGIDYEPVIDLLVEALERCHERFMTVPDSVRFEESRQRSEYIKDNWSIEKTAKELINHVRN